MPRDFLLQVDFMSNLAQSPITFLSRNSKIREHYLNSRSLGTDGKITGGVVDTGGKFTAGVNDTKVVTPFPIYKLTVVTLHCP